MSSMLMAPWNNLLINIKKIELVCEATKPVLIIRPNVFHGLSKFASPDVYLLQKGFRHSVW
jgi:hypothetical protein